MCLFAAWGALKALWEEERGLDIKTRDKGRRIFLCFQSDAESEQHVKPFVAVAVQIIPLHIAGERSSMATLLAQQEELKLHITQPPPHITSVLYGT